MAKSYKEIMNDITTFIFDVDGVLTDGTVHVSPTGEMLRTMHIRDGFAMKAAIECGYNVWIISGGSNEGVRIRFQNLGLTEIHLAAPDKVLTFNNLKEKYKINPENVLYMGDDIPDYHVCNLLVWLLAHKMQCQKLKQYAIIFRTSMAEKVPFVMLLSKS